MHFHMCCSTCIGGGLAAEQAGPERHIFTNRSTWHRLRMVADESFHGCSGGSLRPGGDGRGAANRRSHPQLQRQIRVLSSIARTSVATSLLQATLTAGQGPQLCTIQCQSNASDLGPWTCRRWPPRAFQAIPAQAAQKPERHAKNATCDLGRVR